MRLFKKKNKKCEVCEGKDNLISTLENFYQTSREEMSILQKEIVWWKEKAMNFKKNYQ